MVLQFSVITEFSEIFSVLTLGKKKKKKAEPEQNTSKKLRNWEMKKYNPIYNIWKGGGLFVCVLCFS